jgi:PAS domain S-box-containing protein
MLVEDEMTVAMDVQQRLETMGYRVVSYVTSTEEALRNAQQLSPDLILMDMKIRSGMDGIETAAKIRELQDIPVIYITAYADEPTLVRARFTEGFGYLIKPFDDRDLQSAIEIALYKHRMERKLREIEERYALVGHAANDGIWDWDLVSDEVYYSPRWKTILGLPEDQKISSPQDWLDRTHPEDIDRLKLAINDYLHGIAPSLDCEYRIMHEDGSYRWMLCRGLALFDTQNKPYRMAGSLSDITGQKKSFDDEKQRRMEAGLLLQATFAITSSLNLKEVLDHIMIGLEEAVPFDSAAISLIEEDYLKIAALGGSLRHTRQVGAKIGKSEGLFSLLESSPSPVVLGDAQKHPKYEQWSEGGKDPIHGWMGVPLIAHDRPIGFLMLNSQARDVYTSAHIRLAQAFANQAAVAIENARLFEQVQSGRERLQRLSKKLVEIQEAERRSIARELHDEIGQVLTGLQFMLSLGKERPAAERIDVFSEAQALVSSLMSQVRELSINLHPAMLDDLGLLPTLKAHFERYQLQTGISIHFDYKNLEMRFPAEVELSAFRVVQETLTNVARYAEVKEVDIAISVDGASLYVRVEDHGHGFDLDILKDGERSFGLVGIRERTYLLGGKFEILSKPGEGTRIVAIFPIANKLERRKNDRQSAVGR